MNSDFLKNAIDFLETGSANDVSGLDPDCLNFLIDTGFISNSEDQITFSEHRTSDTHLLKVVLQFRRFFPLFSTHAPRLSAFGGEINMDCTTLSNAETDSRYTSVSGAGLEPGEALRSCLGEAAERICQYSENTSSFLVKPGDERSKLSHYKSSSVDQNQRYFAGINYLSKKKVLVDEHECVACDNQRPSSTGVGAGYVIESAILHGLLELVERDAFSMWWIGGSLGSPIDLSTIEHSGSANVLSRLRGSSTDRKTWLLDITTFPGLPCVAAISSDMNGRNISAGTSCSLDFSLAIRKALIEMSMMEIAIGVAQHKQNHNPNMQLNPKDMMHLKRATDLDATDCKLLHATGPAKKHAHSRTNFRTTEQVELVTKTLAEFEIETFYVEITNPKISIPVVKCISPQLQVYPSDNIKERLSNKIETFGGGDQYNNGVMLY